MSDFFLRFVAIEKAFGPNKVLRGVNLDVVRGETVVVLGGSGSGKSVLLRHAVGLFRPDAGQVFVEGVEISKLRDYCLDPHHPRGRHKARVFLSTLGLAQTNAGFLRAALIQAAREADAVAGASDAYGDRYSVDFEISRGDRHATVRSAWIVLSGEASPRPTSRFVLLD